MLLTRLTASPDFYTYVILAIFLLLAFNIFEIVFLLVHMRNLRRKEARKALLKHRISTAVITEENPAEVLPRPSDAADYEAYSEAAASIIDSFSGEMTERASRLVHDFKVDLYFQRLSRNPVWFKRAHAIDILSSLQLEHNREFFLAAFERETSDTVKYRILYGLSLLPRGREDVYSISRMLSTLPYLTTKYTEDIFYNIITVLKNAEQEEEFGVFLKQIMTDPGITAGVKRDCLAACHAAGCGRAKPIVMEYYSAFPAEPEIIIACIKMLAGLGDFTVLPDCLRHKDWRVRLTAIKYAHLSGTEISPDADTFLHDPDYHFAALPGILRSKDWRAQLAGLKEAHLHSSEILQALKPLLHDPNYHIRINAALALARMGDLGRGILRDEMTSPDQFAADAAKYALRDAR